MDKSLYSQFIKLKAKFNPLITQKNNFEYKILLGVKNQLIEFLEDFEEENKIKLTPKTI